MGRMEDIEALEKLLMEIDTAQTEADRYNAAKAACDEAQSKLYTAVPKFDEENMEKYIVGLIGEQPNRQSKRQEGFINKLIQSLGGQNFKEQETEYIEKREKLEDEYYIRFARQREAVQKEAQTKLDSCIGALADRQRALDEARLKIINNGILPGELKTTDTVRKLIQYLEDGRSMTIRQAVNLLYEEQYKERMEKKADDQLAKLNEILERLSFIETNLNTTADNAADAKRAAREALEEIRRIRNQ